MQINFKKIIAREFLILITVLVIGVLSFCVGTICNTYSKTRISGLQLKIDALSRRYNDKIGRQIWVTNTLCERVINCGTENERVRNNDVIWTKLIKYASEDKLKFKMGIIISKETKAWDSLTITVFKDIMGFSTPEKLKEFIMQSTLNKKEISDYNNSIKLSEEKINLESNLFEDYQIWNFTLNTIAISFVIGFVIRYLFYAILWSINTLKS
jgi:hypothetical protein